MISCQTIQILSFPAPQFECPTEDDVLELAIIFRPLITVATPREAIELRALAQRFIDATAYCQEAEDKLSGS